MKKKIEKNLNILDLLVALGVSSSKSEARRDVTQNAISLNGKKINDVNLAIGEESTLHGKYVIIRKGKKNYALGEF